MKYGIRNSKILLNEIYFWTDPIKDWKYLLTDDCTLGLCPHRPKFEQKINSHDK